MAPKAGGDSAKVNSAVYKDKSKPTDIRLSNINAAKGRYLLNEQLHLNLLLIVIFMYIYKEFWSNNIIVSKNIHCISSKYVNVF